MITQSDAQRVKRLASWKEVFAHIDKLVSPVAPVQMALDGCLGRVVAEDVEVNAPIPSRATALCDGWAVRSEDVRDAGSYAPVFLTPPPAWVNSGDVMPEDTETVLPPDAVTLTAGSAEIHGAGRPGEGVMAAGEGAEPRQPLRRAGDRLRAIDLAILRNAGISHVTVREPAFLVVSAHAGIKQESDAVGPLVTYLIDRDGGRAQQVHASIDAALRDRQFTGAVVIGGSGSGRNDASVRMLGALGGVDLHGVGLRPGDTAALGSIGERPVMVLPGRLDAALAAWLVIGRRLLSRMSGFAGDEQATTVNLARKIASSVGIAEVVLLVRCGGGVEPVATDYFPLKALARADGWVLVPPESEGFAAGSLIEMQSLP